MTSWILFSLLAPLVWAFSNVLDKYILSKWLKDPLVLLIVFGVVGFVAALLVYLFKGYAPLPLPALLVALATGAIYCFANLFYFRAAKTEEISRVIPLIYLDPLFTAVLSAIFIGEILSGSHYLAVLMLVAGAILISLQPGGGLRIGRGVWFCVLAALLYSVNNLLTKYALNYADWWTVFSYVRLGTFLAVLPFIYKKRAELKYMVSRQKTASAMIAFNGILGMSGVVFFTIALSLGYATLTTSLSALQPFFVLFIASILGIFWPRAINEVSSKRIFAQKLLAIVLMFIGVVLITRT